MLVRFAVQNFRSFSEQTGISMVANGRIRRMEDHVVTCGDLKLLRGAFVYGANASGKSNLIRAVDFATKIIDLGSTDAVNFYDQYCKLNKEAVDQSGVFQFDILIDNRVYSYGFALSYRDGRVVEEWLYNLGASGSEFCYFARDERGHVRTDLNLRGESRKRFEVYRGDVKALQSGLFLAEMAKKPEHEDFRVFRQVHEWFKRVIVIFPESVYRPLPLVVRGKKRKRQLEACLTHFDTGIDSIGVHPTTLENELGSATAKRLRERLRAQLADKEEYVYRDRRVLLVVRREKDELKVGKLRLNHKDAVEPFNFVEESCGTKRLFDLIPLFFDDLGDCIVFIDELDRSLHPRLTVEFVNLFYRFTQGRNLQMIVTTHESALLDLNLIRQDEIWLVERLPTGSTLYSLNDFKVRFDKQIEKDYLLGRFGAVPFFSSDYVAEEGEEYGDPQT